MLEFSISHLCSYHVVFFSICLSHTLAHLVSNHQYQWKWDRNGKIKIYTVIIISFCYMIINCTPNLITAKILYHILSFITRFDMPCDIYTPNTTDNANNRKYHITRMLIPMQLQWVKSMTEYPAKQGDEHVCLTHWPLGNLKEVLFKQTEADFHDWWLGYIWWSYP